jgi:predicted Zn-dependent protease
LTCPERSSYDGLAIAPKVVPGLRLPIMSAVRSIVLLLLVVTNGWCEAQATATIASQLDRAARLVHAGDWAKAEQALRALLRAHPNQPDALNLLGIAAGKQGRAEEAEMLFRKALQSNPSLAAASVNLAQLYKERGDGERALRALEDGLAHAPREPHLLIEAARLLADRGQFVEAARRLEASP